MFEFRWQIANAPFEELCLRIASRHGWIGRKTLTLGEHTTVFRRGWFAGAEARFAIPGDGRRFELRVLQVPRSADWRPALFADGVEIPETTGNAPPHIVPAPGSLAMPVGLTYLLMLLTVVVSPQASKVLDTLFLHYADRKAVLTVQTPGAPADTLDITGLPLPPVTCDQPYAAHLRAAGGTPPYTWAQAPRGWPQALHLDPRTGELSGTLSEARDLLLSVTLHDSANPEAKPVDRPLVLVVQPTEPPPAGWPVIKTLSLPPAQVGEPYDFTPDFEGGKPPFKWRTMGKRRLPDGLSLNARTGRIHGTPKQAGHYPVTLRIVDDSYTASQDIVPWVIPFVVTAISLLGFVAMRRWGVYVFAILILLQIGGAVLAVLPVATTALVLQAILWVTGAVHLGKMQ